MKTRIRLFHGVAVVLAAIAVPNSAWAIVIASDNAGNSAYAADATNGAWQGQNSNPAFDNPAGNDNGGFGFLPWNFGGGYNQVVAPYNTLTHFIDGVDFPSTSYNNIGAPAFALGTAGIPYDYDFTVAQRPFAQPLAVGDKFSMSIDTPTFEDPSEGSEFPAVYIELHDQTGAKTVGFWTAQDAYADYGWTYTDATSPLDDKGNRIAQDYPGIDSTTYTANGSSITFKLTSPTTGHVTVGTAGLDVTLLAGAPDSLYVAMGSNSSVDDGSGNPTGEHAFYFNSLKIETTGLAGDYNNNGKVDAADYVVWRSNPAANGGNAGFDVWRANFGATAGAGAGLNKAGGVPEPSTMLLLLCGCLIVPLRRATRE